MDGQNIALNQHGAECPGCADITTCLFLKLPKIEISRDVRFFRDSSAAVGRFDLSKSKANSKIIKTKMISVMLRASSMIDKKLPRRGNRAESTNGLETANLKETRQPVCSLILGIFA
jgi:hypothetical protein